MHPNNVKLTRIYPREKDGRILEGNIPSDTDFEVVAEAKAGEAIHDIGGKYFFQIAVRDLTDFTVVCQARIEGSFHDEQWPEPVLLLALPIPAQGPRKQNHIYEVLVSLRVGARNPNVSFVKSPLFIIV